jgi:hypothetical protein
MLRVGDSGEGVERLHRQLASHGFEAPLDEVRRRFFGPGTLQVVRAWQLASGLEPSGFVPAPEPAPVAPPAAGQPTASAGGPLPAPPAAFRRGVTVDASLVLIGVGSDGQSVEQWDGHRPAVGVMLRWFPPEDLGYPDFGFDVYRAFVGDVLPFRFDDAAVADLVGKSRVLVDNRIELMTTDPSGLTFQPHGLANALVVPSGSRLTIGFPGRAWDLYLGAATFGGGMTVEAVAAGASRNTQLLMPGAQANWRTRGLDRVEVTGDGGIVLIGYRLVDAPYQWSHLGHRSLPVSDPGYPDPAKPAPGTEADEARSRLPADAAADWAVGYGASFADLLPTLTALALHRPAPALPVPAAADQPRLSADGAELLRAALVDPHLGRITGLAFDDGAAGALNQLLAYKVVGRWHGGTFNARIGDADLALLEPEAAPPGGGPAVPLAGGGRSFNTDLGGGGVLEIRLGTAVEELTVQLRSTDPLTLFALDAAGNELDQAAFGGRAGSAEVRATDITRVEIRGTGILSLTAFRWRVAFVERYGLIPGISPADPGPPTGPAWLTATQSAPSESRRVEAELDWETVQPGGFAPELASVGVQLGGLRIGADPTVPQPGVPPFQRKYLLREGGVAVTPPALAARPAPRVLMRDAGPDGSGLADGWYAWWARGVDLFGRCTPATPPATLAIADNVPPPPPMIVLAEHVQAGLPATLLAVLGRSPLATAWLTTHPGTDALSCCLAWTPELAALAPDVDAFRVYVRRPLRTTPADPRDPAETYAGVPWGSAVGSVGPVPTMLTGTVTAVGAGIGSVAVTAVAAEPVVDAGDLPAFRLTTDLTLDTGSGELAGATLTNSGATYTVVGNGEGAMAALLVTAPGGAPAPTPGSYDLARGTSGLLTVAAGIAPPTGDPFRRTYAGMLTVPGTAGDARYRVLGIRGGTLVCADRGPDENPSAAAPAPAIGTSARWYPAWVLTIQDTGFGPKAGAATPVARAQVAVTAVRRSGTARAVESAQSTPAVVLAVDTTIPATPTLPEIPAGEKCAKLATAADWYGISRFTLSFTPDPGVGYVVYRALADAVFRLDHARRADTGYTVNFAAPWMTPLLTGTRGQLVTDDLAALAAALAAAGDDLDAIEAAYEALHTDAARILAAQAWVEPAYVQQHGNPLTAAEIPYTDEFEGRSRSHWFYRVAARSAAGNESAWSAPTPPICSPDVTPPPVPVARLALAEDLAVKVSWLPVPADVDHYLLYRGRDDAEVADPRDLTPALTVDAATMTGSPIQVKVSCAPGEWRFRVVAVDAAGNRSRPSEILAGHALLPPPAPPENLSAARTGDAVHLTWEPGGNPQTDPRLACLLERRPAGEGFWSSVSGWLPRATYAFDDEPPQPDAAWEYRLRVRDTLGQVALDLPTVTVPER